jgi:hypothetical protein
MSSFEELGFKAGPSFLWVKIVHFLASIQDGSFARHETFVFNWSWKWTVLTEK